VSGSGEPRTYLVECYWPGVTKQQLVVAAERARAAVDELRRQGRDLRFRSSILVPADETVFCLFDGVEEDVRAVSVEAGVPFERILESLQIDGTQPRRNDKQ
jgi:hypothetical protein